MDEGFLGRWSRRKLDVKEGKPVEAEPLMQPAAAPGGGLAKGGQAVAALPGDDQAAPSAPASSAHAQGGGQAAPAELPPLTLEDVKALTPQSDFTRFAASNVAPEVKNAAMKKLFADPRYNVMDRMDVYIDDYSQPDPIPESMLRQLVSAKFLGLFDEPRQDEGASEARDVADNPTAQTVAQSDTVPQAAPEPPHHEDADLRLQQDHAAPGEDPGRGAQ